ncbi:MAG: hypothetical protein B7Y15_12610 [Bacteroidetes bacterium 24-39-8]|jgi:hypothetical protein|nr:MAG: hypothetical protein B7Y76_05215 [Sphingobacteriia bacterium 35-40-5]OYZ48127.1 MAG: hypothetical protein B7Y15_12610 [Bacteroidetes bacterium 24-39-8]
MARCIFLLLFLPIIVKSYSQTNSNKMPQKMDLYLLIGQSNMAGRGLIDVENAQKGSPDLWMMSKTGEWMPAKHPLHFDKPKLVGAGPGLAFGIEMLLHNHQPIGLIPCAVGGTSINSWQPGGYDSATKTHPFDDALVRLQKGLESGELKGIIWHQGEADSPEDKRKDYLEKLAVLIERWRSLVHNPKLPFVAGEIGHFNEVHKAFNKALDALPTKVKNTAIASAIDLMDKGDHLHFDAGSANELGKRYATKMLELQKHF